MNRLQELQAAIKIANAGQHYLKHKDEGDFVSSLCEEIDILRAQLAQAEAKLDYVHKMGLRFGMMKTSDKPEPYLMHTWIEESSHTRMFREWSHSIGWEDTVAKLKDRAAQAEGKVEAMREALTQFYSFPGVRDLLAPKDSLGSVAALVESALTPEAGERTT